VNAGFIQGEKSFVRVQAVYDEPMPLDDYEGVDITRITRELHPKSAYELNVMRISVDGKPIDDPGRSSSDIQRCTDVALENARIQFPLRQSRVATASRRRGTSRRRGGEPGRGSGISRAIQMYNNYSSFIQRAEIRIFDQEQSLQAVPLETILSARRAWRSGSRPRAASRGPCASSSSCCEPTTQRAISTKRRPISCGWSASRRLKPS